MAGTVSYNLLMQFGHARTHTHITSRDVVTGSADHVVNHKSHLSEPGCWNSYGCHSRRVQRELGLLIWYLGTGWKCLRAS